MIIITTQVCGTVSYFHVTQVASGKAWRKGLVAQWTLSGKRGGVLVQNRGLGGHWQDKIHL